MSLLQASKSLAAIFTSVGLLPAADRMDTCAAMAPAVLGWSLYEGGRDGRRGGGGEGREIHPPMYHVRWIIFRQSLAPPPPPP